MLICDTDNVMSRLFRKSLTAGKTREWIMPFRLLTLKSSKEMAITTIWCYMQLQSSNSTFLTIFGFH
jgi:hypothetical protein